MAKTLKAAPYRAFYDRSSTTNVGAFTIQQAGNTTPLVFNGVVFKRVRALSGSRRHAHTDWVTGQSGIPYGSFFIWLNPVNPGTKPGTVGIGEFWPMSNTLDDQSVIWSPDKSQKRLYIGIHPDNATDGSAGCLVFPYTRGSNQQREVWLALSDFLHWCKKQGWDYIAGKVL